MMRLRACGKLGVSDPVHLVAKSYGYLTADSL